MNVQSVKEMQKHYHLSEKRMNDSRDAMEAAHKAIEADAPGRKSIFEKRIAEIVGANMGSWYEAEDFAQAFFCEGKWENVFIEFYSDELKFQNFMSEWRQKDYGTYLRGEKQQ